jgi:hypothetical protein
MPVLAVILLTETTTTFTAFLLTVAQLTKKFPKGSSPWKRHVSPKRNEHSVTAQKKAFIVHQVYHVYKEHTSGLEPQLFGSSQYPHALLL